MSLTDAGLRRFGLVMAGALAAFSVAALVSGRDWWPFTVFSALAFTLLAFAAPRLLAPVEWFWMKLAGVMGFVVTNVLLTVFFFLVMTPAALLMRVLGKDPLNVRSGRATTFWVKVESDGPCSRPDKPY